MASNRQPLTRQAIVAHSAEQAYHQAVRSGHDPNHARNDAISKKLIPLYMQRFNMTKGQAKAAVEREMGERYASNAWDNQPQAVPQAETRWMSENSGKREKGCPPQEEATR